MFTDMSFAKYFRENPRSSASGAESGRCFAGSFQLVKTRTDEMKIWIDADAAPRDVKEVVFKAAHRLAVETVLVDNQKIGIPASSYDLTRASRRESPGRCS